MERDESVYLRHMLDAIARIEEYLQGIDRQAFHHQYLVQDGVIRQLEIVREATKHLTDKLRKKYAHVPWQDISGMRDKLIHDYFGVDVETVWLTAKEDIPVLKLELTKILEELRRK
jgi:uncharacterized protein with HEPN domain